MGGGSVNEVKVDKVQEIQRIMKDLNGSYFPVIKDGKKYLKKHFILSILGVIKWQFVQWNIFKVLCGNS